MNQMNMESVIERIAALERMTIRNGCTRPEAEAAARKAAELRQRYNVPRPDRAQRTADHMAAQIRKAARQNCDGVRISGSGGIYLDREGGVRYGETLRIWDQRSQRVYICQMVPEGHRLIFRLFGITIRAFPYGHSIEYLRSVDVGL